MLGERRGWITQVEEERKKRGSRSRESRFFSTLWTLQSKAKFFLLYPPGHAVKCYPIEPG